MLCAGARTEIADCWCRKAVARESRMKVQEGRMLTRGIMLTAGAGRENVDCWCCKGECWLLQQEGRMLTAGAGRENVDCWCRKGEC